jgi:hypothetical protein
MSRHRIALDLDEAEALLRCVMQGGARTAQQFTVLAHLAALVAEAKGTTHAP